MSKTFKPCPRCGSSDIEWTNCRDLNILQQHVSCNGCDLNTFYTETLAFERLPDRDFESAVMKYNAWVDKKPSSYGEDNW